MNDRAQTLLYDGTMVMNTRTPSPSRVAFRICCVEGEDDLRKWMSMVRSKVTNCEVELRMRIHTENGNTQRMGIQTENGNTNREWEYKQRMGIHTENGNTHREWEYTQRINRTSLTNIKLLEIQLRISICLKSVFNNHMMIN